MNLLPRKTGEGDREAVEGALATAQRPLRHGAYPRRATSPALRVRSWFLAALVVFSTFALPAFAAPKFPPLSGRVVDEAQILSPDAQRELTTKLENLETTTGRQLVVATVPSLQDYPIEDFGYQLGRTWGIGEKGKNTGAILLVAPNERKVRIEVGYGLEPVLTDALSSAIIQSAILPKFRDGDMQGGILAGTNAIVEQLSLPADQAQARIAAASQPERQKAKGSPFMALLMFAFVIFLFSGLFRSRRARRGLGEALPWIILSALNSSSGRGGGWSGGGGGGFSGGGGSFGGGGSSGSW
ncbi:Beta-propeller domains of methanol dehydrogenase type [Caulobacter sp. RHG1]|nr:Beta-propeller domains of methanol dehydrogenase type [Caulobacter sp. RHG1]